MRNYIRYRLFFILLSGCFYSNCYAQQLDNHLTTEEQKELDEHLSAYGVPRPKTIYLDKFAVEYLEGNYYLTKRTLPDGSRESYSYYYGNGKVKLKSYGVCLRSPLSPNGCYTPLHIYSEKLKTGIWTYYNDNGTIFKKEYWDKGEFTKNEYPDKKSSLPYSDVCEHIEYLFQQTTLYTLGPNQLAICCSDEYTGRYEPDTKKYGIADIAVTLKQAFIKMDLSDKKKRYILSDVHLSKFKDEVLFSFSITEYYAHGLNEAGMDVPIEGYGFTACPGYLICKNIAVFQMDEKDGSYSPGAWKWKYD